MNDAVEEVAGAVGTATTQATQTVNDTAHEVAASVGGAANGATNATTGRVDLDEAPPPPARSVEGTEVEPAARPALIPGRSSAPAVPEQALVGATGAPIGAMRALTAERAVVSAAGSSEPDDPCEESAGVVCLGLLFGLGDFADAGNTVLGFLAMTGLGILGLVLLAFGLGAVGSGALVAAGRRSVPVSTES